MNKNKLNSNKIIALLIFSAILIAISIVLSISFGSRIVTIDEVINGLSGFTNYSIGSTVVKERIIRTLFCLLAGASLGISGSLMQSITRNPIADPSVLGVNTGASLFVVIGITFLKISSLKEYILLALIGSFLTASIVYLIGSTGSGGATPIKLALAGSTVSAVLSSLVTAIILPRGQVMESFRFWQVGSTGGATWESLSLVFPFLLIGIVIAVFSAPSLNALSLGDDIATGLGVNVNMLRAIGAIGGVMLCGAVTALAGPIGFIGLMAPHLMRLLLGTDQRIAIPMSAVAGAFILTISDVIGRLLGSPGELEVGVVTAFIGAPVLIYTVIKSKVNTI